MSDTKPRILIAVLTGYERTGWVHPQILEYMEAMRRADQAGQLSFGYRFQPVHGNSPVAFARNLISRAFRDSQQESWGDWLAMIDNDMVLPPNFMEAVMKAPADASVIVPRMFFWDSTPGRETTTMAWGISSQPTPDLFMRIYNNRQGYVRLHKCGSGAIFIHRRVFQKIQEPYFWRNLDPVTAQEKDTEDVYFSLKVREAGLKLYGCNFVEVGHAHNVDLSTVAKRLYDERVLTTGMEVLAAEEVLDKDVSINSADEERPSEAAVATV